MLSHLVLALGLLSLTACATFTDSKPTKRPGAAELVYSDVPIVHQTSGRSILRKLNRDTWVEIRNTTKNEHTKLYATLGAAEWDVAIADARAYLQKNPRDEVGLTVLALSLAMKRNYSLSAYYAKLLDEAHPGNAEVYNILGLALMHKPGATINDYKDAMKNFQTAYDSSSQQVASGLNLAHLQLEMGNAHAARDTFQAVRSRCACNEAALGYGIALSRTQEYAKAEKVFQDVLVKEPHSTYARYYLALVAKYGRNDNETAIKHLTALLDDTKVENLEMQRKANFLLRRIQAQVYGKPKEAIAAEKPAPKKAPKKAPLPAAPAVQPGTDIEKVIDAP